MEKSLSADNLFVFILAFIGVKPILHWGHGIESRIPQITAAVSLAVIGAVPTVTTVASVIRPRRDPTQPLLRSA
ncbi:hypothetical protein [Streptomyces griseus]|uniref:hypothetical protein n=1 Tax=Streptomyces griseus TaxID=1911 RepID=UPI00055D6E8F|nr:hypothetical protein [Streptomyces griseus]